MLNKSQKERLNQLIDARRIKPHQTTKMSNLTLEDGTIVGSTTFPRGEFDDFQRLGSLPRGAYQLDPEYQDLHEDTNVYLGEAI